MMKENFGIIILAAGHGKRMKSETPKVLNLLNGRPLLDYVVCAAEASQCCSKPVVVVGKDCTIIKEFLGDRACYAVQAEQLGTGHAVASARAVVDSGLSHILVLYGDMPFITPESINKLITEHVEKDNTVSLMTAVIPDFEDWRAPFNNFGRIVRDVNGKITKIVERKDASAEELIIKEINPAYFCFEADWLWKSLSRLKNYNEQNEYYLTDLVKFAIEENKNLSSVEITPQEAIGVNCLEDLKTAEILRS